MTSGGMQKHKEYVITISNSLFLPTGFGGFKYNLRGLLKPKKFPFQHFYY
jgi:hypothetical protein